MSGAGSIPRTNGSEAGSGRPKNIGTDLDPQHCKKFCYFLKRLFAATWKDIPAANEVQYTIENVECTSDGESCYSTLKYCKFLSFKKLRILCFRHFAGISAKMSQNNAFTVAKRTLEGQDMIYQSLKLSNGIWALVGKPALC